MVSYLEEHCDDAVEMMRSKVHRQGLWKEPACRKVWQAQRCSQK